MTDREAFIERLLFEYLHQREGHKGKQFGLQRFYDHTFKSNGLLTSRAFIGGRLANRDEVRRVIQKLEKEGNLKVWDNLAEVYFQLSDQGVEELENKLAAAEGFAVSEEEVTARRWERLQSVTINERNAETVSSLIDRSLDVLNHQNLTNEQHRQAAAYMLAAKELVSAPVPPSAIIWDLIQKAAAIAGIVQIILPIFGSLI